MPTLDVKTVKLTQEEREKASKALYQAMFEVVGDRVIDVYLSSYDSFYRKGVLQAEPCALISILGAITLNRHDFEILGNKVCNALKTSLDKPDMNVTFSYHPIDQDRLSVNGVLLSDFPFNRLVKE